jgi:hypothetical protein
VIVVTNKTALSSQKVAYSLSYFYFDSRYFPFYEMPKNFGISNYFRSKTGFSPHCLIGMNSMWNPIVMSSFADFDPAVDFIEGVSSMPGPGDV